MEQELEVKIINLPPMRVASAHAFSSSPETDAWKKLSAWAEPKGLMADPHNAQVFGFNNPDPSPGSPNYGYEFWIAIAPEVQPEGDIQVKEFKGGKYAVTRCEVRSPWDDIPSTWKKLVAWFEASPYQHGNHQWLEKHLLPLEKPGEIFTLELYLPLSD